MNNMKCYECVLKHLAGALSYGKEILAGHGLGAELDHRPDFIGELVNCEHHLELLDRQLFMELAAFRRELQSRRGIATPGDLDAIRNLYRQVEALGEKYPDGSPSVREYSSPSPAGGMTRPTFPRHGEHSLPPGVRDNRDHLLGQRRPPLELPVSDQEHDIVFEAVDDADSFRYAYDSIKKYLKNYRKIFVLESAIDLSGYEDVSCAHQQFADFMSHDDIAPKVIVWKQNMALLREFDAKRSFPGYSTRLPESMRESMDMIKAKGCAGPIMLWDNCKPQPVDRVEFVKLMADIKSDYPLSCYFSLRNEEKRFVIYPWVCMIDRPVCCSTKSQLKEALFATWENSKCLESLIRYLTPGEHKQTREKK